MGSVGQSFGTLSLSVPFALHPPREQAYENPSSITLISFGMGHCWGPENNNFYNNFYHPKIGCVGTAVHDSVSSERIALCPPHLRSSQSGVLPELCSLRNFSYIHPHVVFKFDHVRRHLIELQRGSCIPGIFYCMYIAVFGYFWDVYSSHGANLPLLLQTASAYCDTL